MPKSAMPPRPFGAGPMSAQPAALPRMRNHGQVLAKAREAAKADALREQHRFTPVLPESCQYSRYLDRIGPKDPRHPMCVRSVGMRHARAR